MSDSNTTSYRSVFTHEDCTKIHGEPTFQSLKLLSLELKTNARSVHSNLGGRSHGHLGIVLTPAQYALISATPFVIPAYPPVQYAMLPTNLFVTTKKHFGSFVKFLVVFLCLTLV